MLADRDSAERCLDDPDLSIRLVALSILVVHWKLRGARLRTEAVENLWRDLAGVVAAEDMLSSPDAAKSYLFDKDMNVSLAAGSILTDYWDIPIDSATLQRIMGRVLEKSKGSGADSSSQVRE